MPTRAKPKITPKTKSTAKKGSTAKATPKKPTTTSRSRSGSGATKRTQKRASSSKRGSTAKTQAKRQSTRKPASNRSNSTEPRKTESVRGYHVPTADAKTIEKHRKILERDAERIEKVKQEKEDVMSATLDHAADAVEAGVSVSDIARFTKISRQYLYKLAGANGAG